MKRYNRYNGRKKSFHIVSSAITALFVALVIIINAGFFALANRFNWYVDMTKGQVYSLSQASKDLLSEVDEEINIYFTVEADKIYAASPYLNYVYRTALELQAQYSNIHVECIDIIKNPGFFKPYYTTAAQDIYTTSVIVESGKEFRLFYLDAFFITNEDDNKIWAYQGEYKLISAILSMTDTQMPPVYFTSSHGEALGDDAEALLDLFSDAGFEIRKIDLAREDIDPAARIVVINNPVYDFAGAEAGDDRENEIAKLDAFLDDYGCLMVFSSPENAGKLTNLSEFLSEWGISFMPDTYVRDTANAVSTDGKAIVAKYSENTLGASLYTDISGLDTMPKTILKNAMPINILWETNSALDGTREVSAVLSSHDSAKLISNGEETGAGSHPLMTVTKETRIENNDYYYSYVLACGSADYINSKYLKSNTYANSDILYNTIRLTGRERILADIPYKVLDDTELDITTAQANRWTVALVTALPAAAAVCGTAVWIRRKNA